MTRRSLMAALGAAPLLARVLPGQTAQAQAAPPVQTAPPGVPAPNSVVQKYGGGNEGQRATPLVCVLSSNMLKVPWPELGDIAAQLGFEGVDLAVYHGGHVEPDMISVDLVRAFEVVRGAGINVPMISTRITRLTEPNAFGIIALSGNAGVPVFRTGLWANGNPRTTARLIEIKRDMAQLSLGARRYNIAAAVPNHTGGNFGESLADTQLLIADLDPTAIGYFFDIAQAVAVGGAGGPDDDWTRVLRNTLPRLKAVGVSDFAWKDGAMQPCPLGEGVVDFQKLYRTLAQARWAGPISIQMEYKAASEVAAMQKDLEYTRKQIALAYGLGSKS